MPSRSSGGGAERFVTMRTISIAIAAAVVLVTGVLATEARAASAAADTLRPSGLVSGGGVTVRGALDRQFCAIVGNNTVQNVGVALLEHFSKRKIGSSLFTNAVLTSISALCEPLMKRAVPAIARFLGIAPRPTRASRRADYTSYFGRATAAGVSEELRRIGWNRSPQNVYTITTELCTAVRRGASPVPTLRKWFVNGRLDSLPALNGLVAYAATCRPALSGIQLAYLTNSITSYLSANTVRRDYTPPVTLLYVPTETLLANGLVRVAIRWSSFDFGGRVAEQALFIGTNSRWYHLSSGVAYVRPGQPYNLATRARDAAGNWSAWVFTPVYVARMR